MAEAILLAVSKIGTFIIDEACKVALDKLSEKVHNLKQLPVKVKKIEKELSMMNSAIQDLGTENLTNHVIKTWITYVRKLAYHVEDAMDKYLYHSVKFQEEGFMKRHLKEAHYVSVFSKIADEIVAIEEEITHVQELHDRWSSKVQLTPSKHVDIDRQRSGGCFPELLKDDYLVGIEDNRRELMQWLHSDKPYSTVISVCGMGGLGKTTLVKNVYDREKDNFPANAWIAVSQTYDVVDLLGTVLRKISCTKEPPSVLGTAKTDVYELTEDIKEILKARKCLIVLDDVWDQEAYNQMRSAFQDLQESRVLITTRKEDVAAIAHPKRRLVLKPLCFNDSFKLFCKRAFHNHGDPKCPPKLEEVATSIVKRCHGLPLTIVSAGSLLATKQLSEYAWNQIYNQFQSELQRNDHVQSILNLSYHDLPGDLRNCFLYCSLFPEDYHISRESLVRYWVAEGFAVRKDMNTAEDVAEEKLMELISRNMLEVVDCDELGRVSTCKMHDIVRDLALSVAKEEKFGSANDQGTIMLVDTEVRRFSTCRWKDKWDEKVKFPRLRTLMSPATIQPSTDLLSSIFSGSNYLTVLELQDSMITEVPTSVGDLFNLRYIGLRRTRVHLLPDSIEKLSNLQTLDIKQTRIEKLPPGIVKVKKLRHLLADRVTDEKQTEFRYFIGVEAPKRLSNLEELQTLETVEATKDMAEQLKKLKKLHTVWIDNITAASCDDIFSALSSMPLLSSLLLSACNEKETLCFKNLTPISTRLHRLIIRGRWAEGTLQCPIFQNHGKYLRYLALSWCDLGEEDPLQLLASLVPNIACLRLNRVNSAKTLVLSEGCFPELKTLTLKRMPDVNQLKIGDNALLCIEELYIISLLELDMVPQGIESLGSLKKLWLLDLHKDFKNDWIDNQMHKKMNHVSELHVEQQFI